MKKKWYLILSFVVCVLFVACGNSTQSITEDETSKQQTIYQETTEEEKDISVEQEEKSKEPENEELNTENDKESNSDAEEGGSKMLLKVGETVFTATLVENTSTEALKDMLKDGPITISMEDYASMEKVGSFGKSLPRNDKQITTSAGDLILYQGNAFVIYYKPNSWNFTKLGKIDNVTAEDLKKALGSGDVEVTLSLE